MLYPLNMRRCSSVSMRILHTEALRWKLVASPRLFHILGTLSRAARLPFAPIKPVRNYNNYLSKLLLASASGALLIAIRSAWDARVLRPHGRPAVLHWIVFALSPSRKFV